MHLATLLTGVYVASGTALWSPRDDFALLHSLGQLHICSWIVFAGPAEAFVLVGGYKDKLEPWECWLIVLLWRKHVTENKENILHTEQGCCLDGMFSTGKMVCLGAYSDGDGLICA